MDREIIDLYLDDIIPNRFQPREVFDERALRELSDSIREHGVIQPIIVRKIGDKYEIVAGERRYKASAMAGLTKIPAIVRDLDDKETSKVALLENLQRRDLTAIEEARTYHKILELDSMTQEELGKTMGKSQAAIANKLRLLALPDEIQEALLNDQISERHARGLLNLATSQEQIEMLHKIITNRLTVRELDAEIKKKIDSEPKEEIKDTQKSVDIIQPIRKTVNLDELLRTDLNENNSNNDTFPLPVDLTSINSTDDYVPKKPVVIENLEELSNQYQPFTNTESLINEFKNQQVFETPTITETKSLKDVINTLKDTISQFEQQGIIIKMEELDKENNYEIVIKIEKN